MSIFEYDEEKELGRIRRTEREEGKKIGEESGLIQGEKIGLMQGAVNMILTLKELGISKQDTISKVIERFGYTKDKVEEMIEKYWG